jgi:hypothetical protein
LKQGLNIISQVLDWAKSTDLRNPRIFWLYGMAGEGKSSIATSIACDLERDNFLGASFFFARDNQSHYSKAFSTIVVSLCDHHLEMKAAICDFVTNESIPLEYGTDRFRTSILKPILDVKENSDLEKPIILIIDALDECGTEEQRADILQFLVQLLALPSLRILLSSRPEKDIKQVFDKLPYEVLRYDLSSTDSKTAVNDDISMFIDRRLKDVKDNWRSVNSPNWPTSEKQKALLTRACGLFIWASTAMKFIDQEDPARQLDILLETSSDLKLFDSPSASNTLNGLYRTVLTHVAADRTRELFRKAVGTILIVAHPLSPSTLGGLIDLGYDQDRTSGVIWDVISKLRSVFVLPDLPQAASGAFEDATARNQQMEPIRIIHPSFVDFLTTKERGGSFFIDPLECHVELVGVCLQLIITYSKRNPVAPAVISYASGNLAHHIWCVFKDPPDAKYIKSLGNILKNFRNFLRDLRNSSKSYWRFDTAKTQRFWVQVTFQLQVHLFCDN